MYKYLLFDADNTLLDFDSAEEQALRETLSLSPLGFSDEIHRRYHIINDIEWKRLEKGETTRERLRIERFEKLFCEFGLQESDAANKTAKIYTERLAKQSQLICGAVEILCELSKKYRCFIVTNGTTDVQKARLAGTPLLQYVEKVYVSQEMGCAKPSPIFFEKVFSDIGDYDKSAYLVIGDSLSSDIAGANAVQIDSVLISESQSRLPTYCFKELGELFSIL